MASSKQSGANMDSNFQEMVLSLSSCFRESRARLLDRCDLGHRRVYDSGTCLKYPAAKDPRHRQSVTVAGGFQQAFPVETTSGDKNVEPWHGISSAGEEQILERWCVDAEFG